MPRGDPTCRKNVYCRFVESRNLKDAIVEVCSFCSRKVVYNKVGNRIDNARYLVDHLRDAVQPFGRTQKIFEEIYGRKPINDLLRASAKKKSKAQLNAEWEYMRRDIQKRMKK